MKRMVVAVVLLSATSAWAEWTSIGRGEKWEIYVDLTALHQKGNLVKMWSLWDYPAARLGPKRRKYLSAKELDEYDCDERQSRLLYFSYHFGNMGADPILYENNEPDTGWTPVAPDSWAEVLWKTACNQ